MERKGCSDMSDDYFERFFSRIPTLSCQESVSSIRQLVEEERDIFTDEQYEKTSEALAKRMQEVSPLQVMHPVTS